MVDELDPHLAAPRVEAVERVELRELELGLVRGKRFRVRFRVRVRVRVGVGVGVTIKVRVRVRVRVAGARPRRCRPV